MSHLASKATTGGGLMIRLYTDHGNVRGQQRGIQKWMVEAANQYGERTYKGGVLLYTITDRSLRRANLGHLSDRLRGVCIVTSRDGVLLTCYRNRKIARTGPCRWQRIKQIEMSEAEDR